MGGLTVNYIQSLIDDLNNGEPPQKVLTDLEAYLEPLVGQLPDNRDDMAKWVNSACAIFYMLRYVQLARYYPKGHERVDLLHKAAGLMPSSCAVDGPRNDEKTMTVDVVA